MKTKIERINYLNKLLFEGKDFVYSGPKSLFKYRPFDEYAFEMLKNNQIYLCAAEKLDDPTECMTSLNAQNIYDLENDGLKRQCVFQIMEFVRPYTSKENFEQIQILINQVLNRNGTVRPNHLLDIQPEIDELVPGVNTAPIINYLVNIPEKLDEPGINEQIKTLILGAYEARQKMGICSLSEDNDNEYMWKNYAADNSGYCIEYDMSDYKPANTVFPVIYEDERETNIVMSIVANFIGQMIFGMSNHQVTPDTSQYLRLFITKYAQWEYQNEWRILGDANTKINAPKIKRIIVGNKVSDDNKIAIKRFCEENGICLEEKYDIWC